MLNGYKTVKEFAKEWGVTPRRIQTMCATGEIKGVEKFGRAWAIPENTNRPIDGRETTGQYKNWRKSVKKEKSMEVLE